MSSGSACWILWLTPMDWLALSIGRSGSQPLEYSSSHDYSFVHVVSPPLINVKIVSVFYTLIVSQQNILKKRK